MSPQHPAGATPVLETRDLHHSFPIRGSFFGASRELRAIRGIDLKIARGTSMAIVGESGCGKTTLAMILLGQYKPKSGDVLLDGEPLHNLDQKDIARRVQPVLQDPYSSLNPRRTIGEIVELPLYIHGLGSSSERRAKCLAMLDMVGLARRYIDNYPRQLSGGQRQRVAIARALIMRPEIVLCDEPTSALDVSVQSQILNLLTDLQRELGLTYLLISHNLAVVQHMAVRVAVMYAGRIVEEALTDELFTSPRHPYTRALIASILTPEPGLGIPETRLGLAVQDPLAIPPGCSFQPRCSRALFECEHVAPRPVSQGDTAMVECHLYPNS